MNTATPTPARVLDGFIERLSVQHGFVRIDAGGIDGFAHAPGDSLVLMTHDPVRVPETLDVVVVLPEVLKAFPARFRCAVLDPEQSQIAKTRFGITRWPALLFQRDGHYVGAIEGMRDWSDFVAEVGVMLDKPTGRAPSIGIAVASAATPGCH